MDGRVRVSRGVAEKTKDFSTRERSTRTLDDKDARRGGGFRRRAARCESSRSRCMFRRYSSDTWRRRDGCEVEVELDAKINPITASSASSPSISFRDRSKSNKSARRREPCSCATIKSRFFRTSRRYTGPQGTAAAGNVRGTRQYVIRDSPRVSRRRQFRTRTSEPEHFLHSAAPFAAKTPFDARQPLVLSHPHFAHVCPSGAWEGAWGKLGQSSRRDGDQTEERLRRENGNGCASPRD